MPDPAEAPPAGPNGRRVVLTVVVSVVVIVVIFGVILPQLVDWRLVYEAMGEVPTIDLVVIVAISVLRFLPAGWLYAIVLPGLGFRRGVAGWTATTALASSTPGFDIPLRFAMYSSWGMGVERTASSMVLSGVIEMSTKYAIAAVGIGAWALLALHTGALVFAGIGLGILAVTVSGVAMLLRSEQRALAFAAWIESAVTWSSRKLSRPIPSDVVDRVLATRLEVREVLGERWPRALVAAITTELMGFLVVVLSLRAVGIGGDTLAWSDVLLAHGVVIIITTIPIVPGSIGIAEFGYIAVMTAIAGREFADLIGAGVILARLAVWLLPIPIGWLIALRWQATSGHKLFGPKLPRTT